MLYGNEHFFKATEAERLAKRAYLNGDLTTAMMYSHIASKERVEDLRTGLEETKKAFEEYKNRVEFQDY